MDLTTGFRTGFNKLWNITYRPREVEGDALQVGKGIKAIAPSQNWRLELAKGARPVRCNVGLVMFQADAEVDGAFVSTQPGLVPTTASGSVCRQMVRLKSFQPQLKHARRLH